MKIIISPAKKMNVDNDCLPHRDLPTFLPQTEEILRALKGKSDAQLQALWRCNDALAALNIQRIRSMDVRHNLSPAIFSYEGIQYQHMAPNVFDLTQLEFIQSHLRILSGFYGVLRPFDGVTPYRLEMGAKLPLGGYKDLYRHWGPRLAMEIAHDCDFILNLASKEYSKAIVPHLPHPMPFVTCTFGTLVGEKVVERGTLCKMARGEMVRFLAEHSITQLGGIRTFTRLNFTYDASRSDENNLIFLTDGKKTAL